MSKSLISSIAYTNNLMFFTGLIVFLTIFGYSSLAAEIGITYSIVAAINQLFSYNLKSKILFDNNQKFGFEVLNFRINLGIIIVISAFIAISCYELNLEYKKIIMAVVVIVIQQWLLEIFLIINELKKKYNFIHLYNWSSFVNIFLVLVNILFFDNKFLLEIFYFITIINFFILIYFLDIAKYFNLKFWRIFNSISKLFALTSSISIILSIFFWRIFIYLNYEKEISGILFSSFALGSFAGSLFASAIGPSLIKNKNQVSFFSKIYLWITIFFLIIVYFILSKSLFIINLNYYDIFFLKSASYSIAGSSLMLFAVIYRLDYFHKKKNQREYVYKLDILNSFLISAIPVILYLLDKNLIVFSYSLASLISFVMYYNCYKLKK